MRKCKIKVELIKYPTSNKKNEKVIKRMRRKEGKFEVKVKWTG